MSLYRKKPIVIEARQWDGSITGASHIIDWLLANDRTARYHDEGFLKIDTLEGMMTGEPGDWIIKGVKGEFYPCKDEIFQTTYEPITHNF